MKERALYLTEHRWARLTGRVTGQLQMTQQEDPTLSPLTTPQAWGGGERGKRAAVVADQSASRPGRPAGEASNLTLIDGQIGASC